MKYDKLKVLHLAVLVFYRNLLCNKSDNYFRVETVIIIKVIHKTKVNLYCFGLNIIWEVSLF